MKTRTVLLPITVPNSPFCYHKELDHKCLAFGFCTGCYYGFKPNRISEDIVEKDSDCLRLIWRCNAEI